MKKIFRILLLILIFSTCGVLSACTRDNYKRLAFEISYSLDNENWRDASNGNISLSYGDGEGDITLDKEGNTLTGTIYLKVNVKGVKAKYLDKILVQNTGSGSNTGSGLIASGTMVDVNAVVPLSINLDAKSLDGDYINTTIKLTETSSNKSCDVDFDLNPSLKELSMNTNYLPTVGLGGRTTLSTNFLTFTPFNTAQKDVVYSVDSVGYYEETASVAGGQNDSTSFRGIPYNGADITINDGVISVSNNYGLVESNHIVRVRATSVENADISTTFDVYITPNNMFGFAPEVRYANNYDLGVTNPVLYVNSTSYGSNNFRVLSTFAGSNFYFGNGVFTSVYGKKLAYKLNIYVDGYKYNLTSGEEYHGIVISEGDNGTYKVTATEADYDLYRRVNIEFRYELEGVSYTTNSNVASYSRAINIDKAKLATGMALTMDYGAPNPVQENLVNGNSVDVEVYSTNNKVWLTFNALPNDLTNIDNAEFVLSDYTGLDISNLNGNIAYNGNALMVAFADNGTSSKSARIRVQLACSPQEFEGETKEVEYITVTINLTYVVTANEVLAYVDEDCNISVTDASVDGALNITADKLTAVDEEFGTEIELNNYLYLKVLHSNVNLDASTIKLTSTNAGITFDGANKTEITLDDDSIIATPDTGGTVFKIPVFANENGLNGNIQVSVANGNVVLPNTSNTTIAVRSVKLADTESLKVSIDSTNATNAAIELGQDRVNNEHQNFAVVRGTTQNFRVFDKNNEASVIKSILVTTNTTDYTSLYSAYGFSDRALSNLVPNGISENNYFGFYTLQNGTQVLEIRVDYYALVDGIIKLQTKTLVAEFAVYTPITRVDVEATNSTIAYMKDFLEGSSTQIRYEAANAGLITNTIYFSKIGEGETLGTISIGNVNTVSAVYIEENGNTQTLTGVAYTGLAGVSMSNNAINNYSGEVNVQLTREITTTGVTIRFMVYRLGMVADSSAYYTVAFKTYKPADRVVVTGEADVLDKTSVANTTYLYLSTIDEESKSKEFYAAAEWDNADDSDDLRFTQLGYQLYRYAQNLDGSLAAVDGKPLDPVPYSFSGLDVTINEDGRVLVAVTENIGGIFKLVIGTMDSCVEEGNVKTFATYAEIIVTISNGESAANPYTITNVEELNKLNNSNKYFVLAKDVTVDMASKANGGEFEISPIEGFTGTLTGTRQIIANNSVVTRTYTLSLYLDVANTVTVEGNNYSGLFAVLGEGATVNNLNVEVNYSGIAKDAIVGAVAGLNRGLIENVNLTVNSSNISFDGQTIAFGSVVGNNLGSINLAEATLVHNTLNIQSSAVNNYIGGVAGLNSGLIKGNYLGKESLNSIDYTAILNMDIVNTNRTASNVEYYVGGVAGFSSGILTNIIIGGRVNVTSLAGVNNANAYLGGIAGNIAVDDNAINTCAVLGLSLVANTNRNTVAGVVAKADKGTINNSRVIFATAKFASIGTVMSNIQGKNVAGIVAEADNTTTVRLSTVENFISIYEDYNPLKGENVAGISLRDVVVDRSFVYANMQAENELIVLSTGIVANSYYIGFVNGYKTVKELVANKNKIITNGTTNNAYAVVLAENGYYSAYEDLGYVIKTEKLAVTEVNHDTLFKLTEDTVTSDNFNSKTYYVKQTTGYAVAYAFDADATYYEIDGYYAKANYVLQDNGTIIYNNNRYSAENVYYYLDISLFNYTVYYGEGVVVTDNNTLNLNIDYYVNYIVEENNQQNDYTDAELLNKLMPNVYDAGILADYRQLWNVNQYYNTVKLKENTFALPYLLVDNGPLMIVGPSDINVSINQKYVEEISSVYINDEKGFNPSEYDITETVLVNYFYAPSMLTGVNTHKLLSADDDGLLSVDILPSGDETTGGVAFEIVRGEGLADDCAEINGNEITFTGVSNGKPILVRCYSTFNADLSKYAIFFTEYGANALTPVNANLYLDATSEAEYALDIVTLNDSDRAKVNVTFNTSNIYAGISYNSIIANGRKELLNALEISWEAPAGVSVEKLSNQLGVALGVDNATFDDDANNIIKFTLKLNTDKYFGLNYFANNSFIELASTTVYLKVYQAAEGLTVSPTKLQGQAGTTFPITASLQTSYVDDIVADGKFESLSATVVGNTFVMETDRVDGLNIAFECEEGSLAALNALLENAGVDYVTELFNIVIGSTYQKGFGFDYDIKLALKDGFNNRYIESEIVLNLNIYAQTDSNLNRNVKLTLQPAKLEGVELENYAANRKYSANNYQSIITGSAETSIIEPGGLGGVMVARLQPSYADVTDVRILSEATFVPSLGRNVYVMFEQLVYDNDTNTYRTIEGASLIYDNNNNIIGRNLQKVSEIKDGRMVYTGVIYIHTSLENFSGYETTINVTLETKTMSTGDIWQQKIKTLTTKFVPGAYLEYNRDSDKIEGNAYLIQESSSNNTLTVRLDGYQFNANPTITFDWVQYQKDENGVWSWKTVTDFDRGYPTDYIDYIYDFNNLTLDANGSYRLPINLIVSSNLPYAFRVNAKLSLTSSTESREEDASMVFMPTDYILTGLNVTNLVDGTLPISINENKTIDLSISTRSSNDYTSTLNSALINSLAKLQEEANKNLEEANKYKENDFFYNLFKVNSNVLSEYSRFFTASVNNNKLTLLGSSPLRAVVSVQINYRYVPVYADEAETIIKSYKLEFVRDGGRVLTTNFNLNVYDNSTEDVPIAIRSQEEFEAMSEGENYILMNDIVLTNYTPLTTAIASLDGNNFVIYINEFALPSGEQSTVNYGLFASLGSYVDEDGVTQKSILKNVIVAYGDKDDLDQDKEFNLPLVGSEINTVVFGGLVAQNNGGLIYNSEVINLANINRFNLFVYDNPSTNVTFGGLVGINSGIITNSRIGRSSYTSVYVNNSGVTITGTPITNIPALTFNIGNANSDDKNQFTSIAGGFVGQNVNGGIVASSYVANTSLISYSIAKENSRLAGFVAENAGTVSYSYVKALESTINGTQAYSTGASIESRGNGSVAGFVHYNNGNINNSFANTVVTTASNFVSGFVYENRGTITESYAASTLNSELNNSSAEQPFVGVNDKNDVLSYGSLTNVYYYAPNSGVTQKETSLPKASPLNTNNIQKTNNLHGFVFVESNSIAERNQGVWSYYMVNSYEKHILPELNNANMIALSNRYLLPSGDSYANAAGYALASANNPNIIRDAKEFRQVFTSGGNSDVFNGYVRIINNIDLTDVDIPTRTNFTLGSANSISSLEGNGMQIDGIYLDVISPSTSEIGLFANIKNAYVKNLNLNFVSGTYSTLLATYSGGLAGKISDSVISNINLNGVGTTITGNNFAGGLAGLIDGESLIVGVTTNMNVSVNRTSTSVYNLYYNQADYEAIRQLGYHNDSYSNYLTTMSYAGALAGVIDITSSDDSVYNLSYIEINGYRMSTSVDYNIRADFAGGVAGYAGSGVNALRVKYNVGSNDKIYGRYTAGGLFGVGLGRVTASQVTAEEDTQFNYDNEISKYVLALDANNEGTLNTSSIGNLNLLTSEKYVGGLIGLAINANINSSYSRASLTGKVIGGLIGASVATSTVYSYAVPYINLPQGWVCAGGLIGQAFGSGNQYSSIDDVREFTDYCAILINNSNKGTTIQNAFSTLIIDVNNSNNIKNNDADGKFSNVNQNGILDYSVAQSSYVSGGSSSSASSVAQPLIGVYVAQLSETAYSSNGFNVGLGLSANIGVKDINEVYNLNHVNHSATYNDLFGGWRNGYWAYNDSKYFPLLTEDEAINYTEIYQNNFNTIIANPSGSYIIKEDIDISAYYQSGNYVLDINFTGILVGDTEGMGRSPQLYNIQIKAKDEDNSGFFNTTTGAQITGLDFVYGKTPVAGDVSNTNNGATISAKVGYFGGVSATDVGSTFTQVVVRTASDKVNLITMDGEGSIASFGGIVGNATNTTMFNSIFAGKTNIKLYSDKPEGASVGGLIGFGRINEGGEEAVNFTLSGSKVGKVEDDNSDTLNNSTVFDIEIVNRDTSTVFSTANIGGAIGYVTGAAVAGCEVGQLEAVRFNITNTATGFGTLNVGGFAGYTSETNIDGAIAKTSLVINNFNSITTANVAGLVGQISNASGATMVQKAEVNFNADLYKLSASELVASIGVANGINAKIYQSVFKGEISNETSTLEGFTEGNGTINSVIAGGALGRLSGGQGVLSEIVTDAAFTLGGTASTAANMGGLAGLANTELLIDSCVAAGRLIPYGFDNLNTNDDNTVENFKIGGLVGCAQSNLTVNMSISLVSILTDEIDDDKIVYFDDVNAVFGNIITNLATLTNIYYSSDYAMFAERLEKELDNGANPLYNLSAYALTCADGDGKGANSWKRPFASSNYTSWTIIMDAVPYPTALQSALLNVGILESSASRYTYKLGTAFSPQVLNATNNANTVFGAYYRYYVIASATNSNRDCGLTFNGILNGIMLGSNETLLNVKLSNNNNYAGFIPQVGKHSAVANIHVKISALEATSDINGVIVGLNEGVVSGCSVQGSNIKVSGKGQVGLVVGQNSGLVNICYSTAEITEITGVSSVAGIVSTNTGKLASSYFTGYINNSESVVSAGIVYLASSSENGVTKGYVFNCYNAGVIENINLNDAGGGNSFVAIRSSLNTTGSNNFIDEFANSENNNLTVSSENLMRASELKGNWRKVASTDTNGAVVIDTEAHSFGWNYGYPVYYLNKRDVNLVVNDVYFSCYTGNGTYKQNDAGVTENDILTDEENYNNAYKIPHFGVLTSLRALADKNLSYVVIYNLDGTMVGTTSSYITWDKSVGEEGSFTGIVISNKYYDLNRTDDGNNNDENDYYRCTISNFSGSSLFTNITNSTFAYISFGGNITLETAGGVLGNVVRIGTEENVNTVTVNRIKFNNDTNIILANTADYMGGLFGSVKENAVVNINNLTTPGNKQTDNNTVDISRMTLTSNVSPTNSDVFIGLIAGKNEGQININFEANEKSKLNVKFVAKGTSYNNESNMGLTFGGLIGENAAELNGNNLTIEISMLDDFDTNILAYAIGGIVGKSSNGATVRDVSVMFREENLYTSNYISAVKVGALTAINVETTSFENCSIAKDDAISETVGADDAVIIKVVNNHYFGLLAAENSGTINVNVLIIGEGGTDSLVKINTSTANDNIANIKEGGIGGLIGANNSGNLNINAESFKIALNANYVGNVGGLVGLYAGGTINIANLISIEIAGVNNNVGGAFGKVTTNITVTPLDDSTEEDALTESSVYDKLTITVDGQETEIDVWRFLEGSAFANVNVAKANKNVGGLIGWFNGSTLTGIKNNNAITYVSSSNGHVTLTEADAVSNVGGVVGYVDNASAISNLINVGEIGKTNGTTNSTEEMLSYKIAGSMDVSTLTINVGGVIGKLDSSKADFIITSLQNQVTVRGYQNVGGLVGFVNNNVTISNATEEESETDTVANSAPVYGVINVGGAVGLAYNTANVTIDNIINNGSVFGNANVGGIVGYNYQSNITNSKVEAEAVGDVVVKGVIYRVTEESSDSNAKAVVKNYIPTNVGGLVGFIASADSSRTPTLTNNKVININITSAEETNAVISTVSNYMVKVVDGNLAGDYYNDSIIILSSNTDFVTYFNDIKSGFGGFAGGVFGGLNTADQTNKNTLENISINAQLGVNVGTLFGYYNYVSSEGNQSLDKISQVIELKGISTAVYQGRSKVILVDGAYNIGGVIGNLDNEIATEFSNGTLSGDANIILQSRVSGMYVGGLFGKLNAAPSGSQDKLEFNENSGNVHIIINSALTYYGGGLVGRYYVANSGVDFNGTVNGRVTISDMKQSDSIEEFGGLIGMLKIGKASSSSDGFDNINIRGTHDYAFTINTIENSNYIDAATTYDVNAQSESYVYLIAQANYINLDSFNISATSDDSWYDENSNNPLNSVAHGWAKDYTMFKTMQRCIPANENGGKWDAVASIYDASFITEVATIKTLGYQNESLMWDGAGTTTGEELGEDYICYTVYDGDGVTPILYSRIGVASAFTDIDKDTGTSQYQKPNQDNGMAWYDKIGYAFGIGEWKGADLYIDLNSGNTKALTYLDWQKTNYPTFKSGTTTDFRQKADELKSLIFYVEDYLYTSSNNEYMYCTEGNKHGLYFKFSTIYNNYTCNGLGENSNGVYSDTILPVSGSMFNVTGVMTENSFSYLKNETDKNWEKIILGAVAVGVTIATFFLPPGNPAAGAKVLFGAAKVASKAAKALKVLKTVGVWTLRITSGALALSSLMGAITTSSMMATDTYFEKRDSSMGFVSITYARQVSYSNGKMSVQSDAMLNKNGTIYIYYSTVRPSDYYNGYYYVMVKDSESGLTWSKEYGDEFIGDTNNNVTIVPDPDNGGEYYEYSENGAEYRIYPRFHYTNGVYYIVYQSCTTETVLSQVYFTTEDKQEFADYISHNGYYYVKGEYNGNDYNYQSNFDNLITKNGDVYMVNGEIWADDKMGVAITAEKDVLFKKNASYTSADEVNGNLYDIDYDGNNVVVGQYGYYYMKNAYYTAYGVGYEGQDSEKGTFVYKGTDVSSVSGNEGSDYIKRTYKYSDNGVDYDGYMYYQLESVSNGSGVDYNKLSNYTANPAEGNVPSLEITLQASAFANPYANSIKYQDNNYYTITNEERGAISHTVKYYYYEGGYEYFAVDPDKTAISPVYVKVERNSITLENGTTFDLYGTSDSDALSNVYGFYAYRKDSSSGEYVSYQKYVENTAKYENWYLEANENTELFRVGYNYKVKDNYVYTLDSNYTIKDGLIHAMYLSYATSGEEEDYNVNKILMNSDYQIYTRYNFNGNAFVVGEWRDKDDGNKLYNLFNANSDPQSQSPTPNPGKTTYLVESVCVTLGGGYTYQFAGNQFSGTKCGTITPL